jgi:ATP-dependent exoDNAse (exonuclease V) beta subunit
MNDVEVTTASAGSGKTFYLTELLDEELDARRVRPEGVLAVTFTKRAAGELSARARQRLLGAGRVSDAQALATARIGTVHSVCSRLVSEFAFELGLAPEVEVLDATSSAVAFREALSRVIDESPLAEKLDECSSRFAGTPTSRMSEREAKQVAKNRLDWRGVVEELIAEARSNDIRPEQFSDFAKRSVQALFALFPKAAADGAKLDRALLTALEKALGQVDTSVDTTKTTREVVQMASDARARLSRGDALPWADWLRLSKLKAGKKSAALFERACEAAQAHDRHPKLREDLQTLIEGAFEIARQAYDAYAGYKRERGLVDFTDQESQAYALLQLEPVRDQLAQELDLVLVDEFQDTSPLQLAIFLELSKLAKRSVWVGDQKQSIYGFRGADPRLIDAVLEQVVDPRRTTTLGTSYRSRPGLVRMASELFAQAFSKQGIPRERVLLEPHLAQDPEGLGPVLERWVLDTKNKAGDNNALARLVTELLQDASVQVRDRERGEVRPVRPGDVAVLCRTNDGCDQMADELERQGLAVQWARGGLTSTPEVRLWLAGFAVLADPDDTLHAAEIVRLLAKEPNDDGWLEALLLEGAAQLKTHPTIARLHRVHKARPTRAPLELLDLAAEVLLLREVAAGWRHGARRLANLDAFRMRARALVERLRGAGEPVTSTLLLGHLQALEGDDDRQALPENGAAVHVCTWHASKGLEWPITILSELNLNNRADSFGVRVCSDEGALDLRKPLHGRHLRYWPFPYGSHSKDVPLLDRLTASPEHADLMGVSERENLRLAYVAFTRARDRLILAGRSGKLDNGALEQLSDDQGQALLREPEDGRVCWAGVTLEVRVRASDVVEPSPVQSQVVELPVARGFVDAPRAWVLPSELEAHAPVVRVHELGPALVVQGQPDKQALGEAAHAFLGALRPRAERAAWHTLAQATLVRWGVQAHLDAGQLVDSACRLRNWADAEHPEALWRREYPVQRRAARGTLLRGVADLLLETPLGWAVVDHKALTCTLNEAVQQAQQYGGQLHAYAWILHGLRPTPKLNAYIHLPLHGLVVELDVDPSCEPAWPVPSRRLSALPDAI